MTPLILYIDGLSVSPGRFTAMQFRSPLLLFVVKGCGEGKYTFLDLFALVAGL